ncbi:MAG: 3D domain-containing protein [Acidobacteriaceae bacterium]|nr:3D domain-containing protein [Acidobacteriaceae bacterium]
MLRLRFVDVLLCLAIAIGIHALPAEARTRRDGVYIATAYSTPGQTASQEPTRRHGLAADPTLLPLGSRIRVTNAGRYSGEYEVIDTGSKIQGRKIDIFMPNTAEAKRFGKRRVRIQVIELATQTASAK